MGEVFSFEKFYEKQVFVEFDAYKVSEVSVNSQPNWLKVFNELET